MSMLALRVAGTGGKRWPGKMNALTLNSLALRLAGKKGADCTRESRSYRRVTLSTYSAVAKSYCISKGVGRDGTSLGRFLKAVAAWRLRHRQRAQLYALSDHALKDIGIRRCEIEGIVNSPNRDASGRVH